MVRERTNQGVVFEGGSEQLRMLGGGDFELDLSACDDVTGFDREPVGVESKRLEDFAGDVLDSREVAFAQVGALLHRAVRGFLWNGLAMGRLNDRELETKTYICGHFER
jgi:hypothetical protein